MAATRKVDEWLTEEGLALVIGWARDGLTNPEIAVKMGVARSTLIDWQKRHKEFGEALRQGKEVADRKVEMTLYKRALGYDYDETTEIRDKNNNIVEKKKITRHMPPDVGAICFWLKNRKRGIWVDRPQANNDDDGNTGVIEITAFKDNSENGTEQEK